MLILKMIWLIIHPPSIRVVCDTQLHGGSFEGGRAEENGVNASSSWRSGGREAAAMAVKRRFASMPQVLEILCPGSSDSLPAKMRLFKQNVNIRCTIVSNIRTLIKTRMELFAFSLTLLETTAKLEVLPWRQCSVWNGKNALAQQYHGVMNTRWGYALCQRLS